MWNKNYDSENKPTEQNIREYICSHLWLELTSYL